MCHCIGVYYCSYNKYSKTFRNTNNCHRMDSDCAYRCCFMLFVAYYYSRSIKGILEESYWFQEGYNIKKKKCEEEG